MLEPPLLRIGAVSIILGVIISGVSGAFHGGHQPHDLVVTLPLYATNANWIVVHLGQFLDSSWLLAVWWASIAPSPWGRAQRWHN